MQLVMDLQASRCNFNMEMTGATVSRRAWRRDGHGWWCPARWSWHARSCRISFQRALNAGNSNAKQLSEVECAAQIASQIKHGMKLDAAIAQVKACDPACKMSLDVIGCYVAMYGGGEHLVLIDFLSKFSNLAAINKRPESFQAILAAYRF